jgi:hypothetical protein
MHLGCDTFHFGVHYSVEGILLEADATGHTFISGWIDRRIGEKYQVYDEQLDTLGNLSQFSLLQVPEPMQAAMKGNQNLELERKRSELLRLLEENPQELPDQLEVEDVFTCYMPRIDHALAEVINGSQGYWYLDNLVYHVYAKPQQLEADGARVLYFQPPTSTIQNLTQDNSTYNTQPDTDSGLFADEDDIPW